VVTCSTHMVVAWTETGIHHATHNTEVRCESRTEELLVRVRSVDVAGVQEHLAQLSCPADDSGRILITHWIRSMVRKAEAHCGKMSDVSSIALTGSVQQSLTRRRWSLQYQHESAVVG
jgi:hypothetical protein